VRVAGPLVEVTGLAGAAMAEIVSLGPLVLPGEVVALRDGVATIQAYEYTGGLAPGDPVSRGGVPLSAPLGPGLLGAVVDGLLRPLGDAGPWLRPGRPAQQPGARWVVRPLEAAGALVAAGCPVAVAEVPDAPDFLVLVPPGVSGRLLDVAPAGEYAGDAVLAAVQTPRGTPVPVPLTQHWPIRRPRPYLDRVDQAEVLTTGQRVVDQLFPIARGSSVAVPGGFGTGKTMLLQQVAKWCDADVIVYVGCGERGNEMADVVADLHALVDPRTGRPLARRTVVVANTSNMPMMAREASIHSGATVAEVFRDMGYHTVVIADSTSRWAEALREFSSRSGALPAEEGYPAELASALAAFYERAGHVVTLGGREGSVSVIGAVSPPGGDRAEPVTANTERFVRGVWSLDRDLAYARHYPAVAWSGSFSRDADALGVWHTEHGDPGWPARRARVLRLLADADRLQALADLVGLASLPAAERVVLLTGRLLRDAVLQQSALSDADAACSAAKGAALLEAVLAVADRCQALVEQGVPASRVEEHDFSSLVRAREETGPRDLDGVQARRDAVLLALDELGQADRP
jgi:V/A-type H+-transporting ATPase subunit A